MRIIIREQQAHGPQTYTRVVPTAATAIIRIYIVLSRGRAALLGNSNHTTCLRRAIFTRYLLLRYNSVSARVIYILYYIVAGVGITHGSVVGFFFSPRPYVNIIGTRVVWASNVTEQYMYAINMCL